MIRFSFDVPANENSSSQISSDYHSWTVDISGETEGVNFERTYEVPVFVIKSPK